MPYYHHSYDNDEPIFASLRHEIMASWIEKNWIPENPETDWVMVGTDKVCLNPKNLELFTQSVVLKAGYRFAGRKPTGHAILPFVMQHDHQGKIDETTGSYIYRFTLGTVDVVEVLVLSVYFSDGWHQVCMACVPQEFMSVWADFLTTCRRLAYPEQSVMVIGGNQRNFEPRVTWDEIILEENLKQTILKEVENFYTRGVAIYQRLNINPFRKILLAGVPGTGKTMLCNALAKWAIDKGYQAIYVSSADANGAQFWKIQQALHVATNSQKPALILLEELDAYLNAHEKALILNVLDGSESFANKQGTLLIATTNYPESIDERVLKRPGRLDRIYIIPPIKNEELAERMLKHYLGDLWLPEHAELAPKLVGYPGAFIREVAVFALTQLVDLDADTLTLDVLQSSFERLQAQIEARDEFIITQRKPEDEADEEPSDNANGGSKG